MSDSTRKVIENFIASAVQPVLMESGEEEIPLIAGSYSLDPFGTGVRFHAWTEERSYSRRITGIHSSRPGRLELKITRFGQPDSTVTLMDLAYGRNQPIRLRGQRESHREQFRRMLARQYPGWKISRISTAPDLQHSLSPAYPRAMLRQGTSAIAAIAAPQDSLDPDGVLTFGLIWLDYLRRHETQLTVSALALFLPETTSQTTALRMRYLDSKAANFVLYLFSEAGEQRIDIQDWGNLSTDLRPASSLTRITQTAPESQLEGLVQTSVRSLDAALDAEPVYRQALSMAALDRGILDLLAVDLHGRLAVIELKVTEDIHLPLQALDYWMRIRWHLDKGSFARLGYFPRRTLISATPLLYLVAPALEFHPMTNALIRYLSPEVPVIQLGLGANWRSDLKVVSRQERDEHSSTVTRRSGQIEPQ